MRCTSEDGVMRCVLAEDHSGAHIANVGPNTALRWGMRGFGCCDPNCYRRAAHPLPHRDGKGVSWWPIDADEPDAAAVPAEEAT